MGRDQALLINIEKIRPMKNAFHPDRVFTCHLLLCPTLGTIKEETVENAAICTHKRINTSQALRNAHSHSFSHS